MGSKAVRFVALAAMVATAVATLFTSAVPAEAAASATPMPLTAGEVVVDDVGGHVFVTATDTVAVFDLAGTRLATIGDLPGAVDLVLRGRTLTVLSRTERLTAIDADTFEITGTWAAPGVTQARSLAWSAGAWWITYGDQFGEGLAKLDPATGAVSLALLGPTGLYAGGDIAATTDPARLYVLDRGLSPSKVRPFDVSSGLPVALATSPHTNDCGGGAELALAPAGAALWTACGSPYRFNRWDRTALGAPSAAHPATNYPDAVTVSGDGEVLVGGTDSIYGKDVWVYDADAPAALKSLELGAGLRLLPGMLATTTTGDRVFAVTGDGVLRTLDFRPKVTAAPAGVPAEEVTEIPITGTELADVTSATVGGTPAAVRVDGTGTLRLSVPALEGGTFPLTLTSRWGSNVPSALAQVVVIPDVPEAPAAPTVTATPPRGVTLTWAEPGDGGSPVLGYRVQTRVGDEDAVLAEQVVTGTSTTVEDLVAETGYRFTVTAVNAVGDGPASPRSELAAAGLPAFGPFATVGAFVDRQHQDLLGTAPTAADRDAWIAALRTGAASPAGLVVALRGSEDHRTNVDPVARLYLAYFGRPADASGLAHWTARRRAGVSLSSISGTFASSAEFRRSYAGLGNRGFVELVYANVLGRPGDVDGIRFWTRQLDSRRLTRGAVMIGFSEAPENVRATASELSASIIPTMLVGTAPGRARYQATVDELDAGGSAAEVATAVLGSTVYATRITALG